MESKFYYAVASVIGLGVVMGISSAIIALAYRRQIESWFANDLGRMRVEKTLEESIGTTFGLFPLDDVQFCILKKTILLMIPWYVAVAIICILPGQFFVATFCALLGLGLGHILTALVLNGIAKKVEKTLGH